MFFIGDIGWLAWPLLLIAMIAIFIGVAGLIIFLVGGTIGSAVVGLTSKNKTKKSVMGDLLLLLGGLVILASVVLTIICG